jgi:transcriptional regulator with XRE-family HTH domain
VAPPRTTDDDRTLAIYVAAHALELQHRLGISQNEIERKAHLTIGRLSRFLSGERVAVPPSFLVRLSEALGTNPAALLTRPGPTSVRWLEEARRRFGLADDPPRARLVK